jgi:hypothetical protein
MDKRTAVALGRKFVTSPEMRERLNAHNAEQIWYGTCRKCGAALKGRPDELKEHRCGPEGNADPAST